MKEIIILAFVVFIFTDFKPGYNTASNENVKIATSVNQKLNRVINGRNQCAIIKGHPFSNQAKIDTFKLVYNCENLEDSMVFRIIGSSGEMIYERRFLGIGFYDYSRPWFEYITDPKRGRDFDPDKLSSQISDSLHKADLKYIKLRMNKFFNDENFISNPMSKIDKDMFIKDNYKEISGDSTLIGFSHTLFVGGGSEMIAYSKKIKKVLLIVSSD